MTPSNELRPGVRLLHGRFEIGAILGRGGFGITYEAVDTRLDRRVAVKELFPEDAARIGLEVIAPSDARAGFERARVRFLREARSLARFNHPGIVRVFEVFEENGTAYLVLELLEGRSLADLLRARGLPLGECEILDAAEKVGGALQAIHEAGLLHRDVSPSNMVALPSGRIVLIDFGLARDYDPDRASAMTRIVTPGYAPPEQYLASARFGPPTDIYGLAASLYRLMTATAMPSAIEREHGTQLVPPHRLNPEVSKLVSDAVLDGLELNPGHRPPTVAAFLSRLGVDGAKGASPDADRTVPDPRPDPAEGGGGGGHTRPIPAAPASAARPAGIVVPAPEPRPVPPPGSWIPVARRHGPDAASYLPGPVLGPRREGRWVAWLPIALAAVALDSSAPVLVSIVLVLVALPGLATAGDLALHHHRRSWGAAQTWFQRQSVWAAVIPRFGRNMIVSVMRALPALALLAFLVACWYPIHDAQRLATAADWFLRLSGVAVGMLLVLPAMSGSNRFRSGVAVDSLHARIAPDRPGRRSQLTQRGWILWICCIAVAAAAVLFAPDVWPLHG